MAYTKHDFEKIGERIKNERKTMGISSLEEMSEKIENSYGYKISRQALSDIEKGNNTKAFTVDLVDIFCEMFDCDAAYLLCEYDDCKTYDNQFIHNQTGLSENAINYLHETARSKRYIEIINNIFLKYGNFDNALFHIDKYMENVSLYQGLTKIRRERLEKIISECIQKDGDLTSYNYPYNDTLDKKIHETGRDLDIEEFKIDQHFKFIIQEIERIAKEKAPDTN